MNMDQGDRIEKKVAELVKEFNTFKVATSVDIAKMQLKQSMEAKWYGILGGAIPSAIVLLVLWAKSAWHSV